MIIIHFNYNYLIKIEKNTSKVHIIKQITVILIIILLIITTLIGILLILIIIIW
jgi:hypothetical protein